MGSNQLLNGLEELRDAGAEAIEINDKVRVVAQTSLKDTGGGVLVDGTLLKSPYVIEAIGDPHTPGHRPGLQGRVHRRGAAASVDGKVDVVEVDGSSGVKISTVVEPATPRFAQPGKTRIACRLPPPDRADRGEPCTPRT